MDRGQRIVGTEDSGDGCLANFYGYIITLVVIANSIANDLGSELD